MGDSTIVFPEGATSHPGFNRFETLVTPADVNRRYLHGVDTRDNKGKKLSPKVLEFAIQTAISQLEHELEITINPTTYVEEQDYKSDDYWNWGFIQLRHKPIISIDKFQIQVIPGGNLQDFSSSWIRPNKPTGQIQIAPISGPLGTFNLGQFSFLPRLLVLNDTFPNFFMITYTAGFEQNKIPCLINQVIGILAAMDALNVAGDLVLGAGIASTAIGIDGLSQSISSTASAENTAYGARMKDYVRKLKEYMIILRRYYGKNTKMSIV